LNRRSPVLVSAPAQEPVTLSEAKTFLRVDGTDDDTLITSLLVTARRLCEEYTKRTFITQTWRTVFDRFPIDEDADELELMLGLDTPRAIQLSRQPIQSISSIKTTSTANVQTTVASATYTLDQSGGRVLLNDGYSWPTDLRGEVAVEITTVNGYGDNGGTVPEPIKQAILTCTNAMYSSRQCGSLSDACKEMLAPYMAAEAFGAW
jgi:uncharacterized phiE125 gp8 family phage protein